MLSDIIKQQVALTTETIVNIRGTDGGTVPRRRETRMNETMLTESIWTDAKESFFNTFRIAEAEAKLATSSGIDAS